MHLATRHSLLATPPPRGVTLIELLITVTIIAILAATFVGVSTLAIESTRKARTKSTITKIHGLVMERWNDYETRSVEINPDILRDLELKLRNSGMNFAAQSRERNLIMADLRLLGLRELMKLEMPDRWSDVVGTALPDNNPANTEVSPPIVLARRPALAETYLRRFRRLSGDRETLQGLQGAECLFMVVMYATGDGEARTMFTDQEIGDLDNDGAPEFLDGWGQAIQWIRWAPGFLAQSQLMSGSSDADHDPFDPFLRDIPGPRNPISLPQQSGNYPDAVRQIMRSMRTRQNNASVPQGFRLVPLVFSVGSDGDSDILVDTGEAEFRLDPYSSFYGLGNNLQMGTAADLDDPRDGESFIDNIHNHQFDAR